MSRELKSVRDAFVERVREALELNDAEMKMPLAEYIDALEEIQSDVETSLDAARDDQRRQENTDDEDA